MCTSIRYGGSSTTGATTTSIGSGSPTTPSEIASSSAGMRGGAQAPSPPLASTPPPTGAAYGTSYTAENANDLFAVSLQPAPPHPNQPLNSSPQVLIGAVVVVVVVTFSAGSYLVWKRTVGKRLG